MATSSVEIIELNQSNTCKLCENALAKYSCPKCNILYCSLPCYRSQKHLECSEKFYKDCITEELGSRDERSQQAMLDILKGYNVNHAPDEEDSDDGDDVDDLENRLAGVDLDNADDVWEKLTEDERQEFIALLKTNDVTKLVPSWEPWWRTVSPKVQTVDQSSEYKTHSPALMAIKDFSKISKKAPDKCVQYNLVNVIAAYAFTARYFNGEHTDFTKEAATCTIAVSLTLKNGHNFDSFDTALKAVEMQCTESDWIVADVENYQLLREDVTAIFEGPCASDRNHYVLAALSDLHTLMQLSLDTRKNEKRQFAKLFPDDNFPEIRAESRNKIKGAMRKIDYLLSYAKDKLVQ